MSILKICRNYDSHDCDTCGSSYADGATIYLDGKQILDLVPIAHCYDNVHYYDIDIFIAIADYLNLSWNQECEDENEFVRWMAFHNYKVDFE